MVVPVETSQPLVQVVVVLPDVLALGLIDMPPLGLADELEAGLAAELLLALADGLMLSEAEGLTLWLRVTAETSSPWLSRSPTWCRGAFSATSLTSWP